MVAVAVIGLVLGVLAVRRLLESRSGFHLDALGTVSRDWIASQLRRAET